MPGSNIKALQNSVKITKSKPHEKKVHAKVFGFKASTKILQRLNHIKIYFSTPGSSLLIVVVAIWAHRQKPVDSPFHPLS